MRTNGPNHSSKFLDAAPLGFKPVTFFCQISYQIVYQITLQTTCPQSFIWQTIYRSLIFEKVQLSGLKTNFESFEVIKDCYWRCYDFLHSADLVLAHKGTLPSFFCSGYLSPCSLKDTLVLYGNSYCYFGLKLQIWRRKGS